MSRPEKFLIVPIPFVPSRIFLNSPKKSRLSRQRKKFKDIILFKNHVFIIIIILFLTIVISWFLTRYCDNIDMWYEVDVFTVYFFVAQFVCLIYKWLHQDLPIISFTLHQKATCLSMALITFIVYDIFFSLFVPTYISFATIWLMSIIDM